jgi:ornithine carbamoyltransferase
MGVRHFLTLEDHSSKEILGLFKESAKLKADLKAGKKLKYLSGKSIGLIFHKPSLRTRVSFEAGVSKLGGQTIFMESDYASFGVREPIRDHAKVISRYVDGIVIRTFDHDKMLDFAKNSDVPVINGLTDYNHPCQAVTDLFTVKEHFKTLSSQKLAFIGDGNNVSRSLAIICTKLGVQFALAHPKGYGFSKDFMAKFTAKEKSLLQITEKPAEAAKDASVFYSDVFTSMGQEAEREKRLKIFKGYQINKELVSMGRKDAIILHCLPAHRGEEITAEVIDGPRSLIYEQAENRMHTQNAIMKMLIS